MSNHKSDITIIIPTYNRLWCLPQAIESCRGSQFKIEIIVIDDGSTDGTWQWLQEQPDIITLQQPNLGKCWAVNKAFNIATGKYIRFLDSDDVVDKMANDEQFQLGEDESADVVVSGYKVFEKKNEFLKSQLWISTDDFVAQQLGETDSSHYSSYLFKKQFIEDIPHRPDYAFRDDRLFVLEMALKNPVIAIHPGTALLHRIAHYDRLQISKGIKYYIQNYQHLNIYKYILGQLKLKNELTPRRIDASLNILWPLSHWIAKYNIAEAGYVVKWIFELKPQFVIPEKGLQGFLYRRIGFKRTEQALRVRRFFKYLNTSSL